MHGITGSDLHPQLIMPDGVFPAADDNPPAAGPVFLTDKFRIFPVCLARHEIINNAR